MRGVYILRTLPSLAVAQFPAAQLCFEKDHPTFPFPDTWQHASENLPIIPFSVPNDTMSSPLPTRRACARPTSSSPSSPPTKKAASGARHSPPARAWHHFPPPVLAVIFDALLDALLGAAGRRATTLSWRLCATSTWCAGLGEAAWLR